MDAFKKAKTKEKLLAMVKEAGDELIQKPYDELSKAELAKISGGVQGTAKQAVNLYAKCIYGLQDYYLYWCNAETGESGPDYRYPFTIYCGGGCKYTIYEDDVCYCAYGS